MADIIDFPVQKDMESGPRLDIAKALRRLADEAEKGDIKAFAGTFTRTNGTRAYVTATPEYDHPGLIGALMILRDYTLQEAEEALATRDSTVDNNKED